MDMDIERVFVKMERRFGVFCQVFKFPKWSEFTKMCWLCFASGLGDELGFTLCGPGAGWRSTMRSHESYIAELEAAGKQLPVLLARIIGMWLECVMIDVLHTLDLGVAAHVIGNVFLELVRAHAHKRPAQCFWPCARGL